MQRTRKRNHRRQSKPLPTKPISIPEPYPSHPRPTPEECLAIRDDLLQLHGFPVEFAKYRERRRALSPDYPGSAEGSGRGRAETAVLGGDGSGSGEEMSVLDGLVSTVLSQNTTYVNSQRAFASLKDTFSTWEEVLDADTKLVEDSIRCGGLAPTKASCIKNILTFLMERKGKLCLEYLRDLSVNQIKEELSSFKGIGPKTVACVLLFHLQQDDFPVDTHIFQIAKTLGWVPEAADMKKTYFHLNQRIPYGLKFDLNCLLFTHGKACSDCAIRKKQHKKHPMTKSCPLLNYRSKF